MEAEQGRPTLYSTDIADRIIHAIGTTSQGLQAICAADDMPCRSTVYNWLDTHPDFLDRYTRAKESQADVLAEEIISISDDDSNDTIKTERGDIPNHEWISRSRLRVDSRKWLAAKLAPKKYGDKLDVTSAGDKISTIAVQVVPPVDDDE